MTLDKFTNNLIKIAVIGGFVTAGTGYLLRVKTIKKAKASPFYIEALTMLRNNDGAQKVLGLPILEKEFDLGNSKLNYFDHHEAYLTVPVKGTKGKGYYKFWGTNSPEGWKITRAELEIEGIDDKILAIKREEKVENK